MKWNQHILERSIKLNMASSIEKTLLLSSILFYCYKMWKGKTVKPNANQQTDDSGSSSHSYHLGLSAAKLLPE